MEPWRWAGDHAMLRTYAGDVERANALARAAGVRVRGARLREVLDVVPGERTLLVVLRPGAEPSRTLRALLSEPPDAAPPPAARTVEMPVDYDGEDLEAIAATCGIDTAEVVRLHVQATYTVAFLGFSPGFPYLLGLPPALHLPRRATPRARVPAGSVAIAGGYACVYPSPTAGGWHLLGRTTATLFDPARTPAALLAPGDRVRFVAA